MTATATKTRKAAAKGARPATKPSTKPSPKALDNVPETDAAPKATASRGGNSAYAAETVRNDVAKAMHQLRDQGFTRPSISAVTGYTDSQVWRAFNGKVHASEVATFMDFIQKVVNGEVEPPARARKPKAEDLQAKIDAALAALADEAKTAAQYRAVVAKATELLSA